MSEAIHYNETSCVISCDDTAGEGAIITVYANNFDATCTKSVSDWHMITEFPHANWIQVRYNMSFARSNNCFNLDAQVDQGWHAPNFRQHVNLINYTFTAFDGFDADHTSQMGNTGFRNADGDTTADDFSSIHVSSATNEQLFSSSRCGPNHYPSSTQLQNECDGCNQYEPGEVVSSGQNDYSSCDYHVGNWWKCPYQYNYTSSMVSELNFTSDEVHHKLGVHAVRGSASQGGFGIEAGVCHNGLSMYMYSGIEVLV
jgi:hypothetical protein